ncbi:MAG: hypothetical protein IPO92_06730 [Saprospiraceae bacterium]|nr:hypothetical protein [Saprospiraceae bacterium]
MYIMLKYLHSYFAWITLAFVIICIIVAAVKKTNKKPFTASNLSLVLLGLISTHIQLLLGLFLYFTSPYGLSNLSGTTMKDSLARLLAVEHPFVNIIAIILITIGYSKAKRAMGTDKAGHAVLIFYTIALLLILSRIPWQLWF